MRPTWSILALVLALLAGCGLEGGGGAVAPREVTLRFYDSENALLAVYYRVAGGAWRRAEVLEKTVKISLPSPEARLEVAAECGPSYRYTNGQILLAQGEAGALQGLVLPCSLPHPYMDTVSVPVAVGFPGALGGVPLSSTDLFTLDGFYSEAVVPNGVATLYLSLPPGPQKASLLVYRPGERGARLLGGKVFDLVAEEGRTAVVALSEEDGVASRVWALTAPHGGYASAQVLYFRGGMRQPFAASPSLSLGSGETRGERYALFPGGGVYLGQASGSYGNAQGGVCGTGCSRQALLLEDTQGLDWSPALPPPWPEGTLRISPDGRAWRLGFPGAKGYWLVLSFPNERPLNAWTSSSDLSLPDLEPLFGFRYPASGEVWFSAGALARGELSNLFTPLFLSESALRGSSYALSTLSGIFTLGQGGSF